MKKCYIGKCILPDKILENAYLEVTDGVISFIGNEKPAADEYEVVDGYIAPGFIDIHCHSSLKTYGYDDPEGVADYHYRHGTTSMLITMYRGLGHENYLKYIDRIKEAMPKTRNVRGIHLEGPYLNGKYGCMAGHQDYPVKEEYMQYLASGIIRQWTCSPEVEGSIELIREIKKAGCVPALGHSDASYSLVKAGIEAGAGIATHLYDATGTTPEGIGYIGTHDVSFNEACLLADDMYYEVICDRNWIHLRREMLKFIEKTVGIDRIVAITDSMPDETGDDLDINIVDGIISGSKLTMDAVAGNLFRAGYSLPQISRMTARNAARAINLEKRGEIAEGYYADLIRVDGQYGFLNILN